MSQALAVHLHSLWNIPCNNEKNSFWHWKWWNRHLCSTIQQHLRATKAVITNHCSRHKKHTNSPWKHVSTSKLFIENMRFRHSQIQIRIQIPAYLTTKHSAGLRFNFMRSHFAVTYSLTPQPPLSVEVPNAIRYGESDLKVRKVNTCSKYRIDCVTSC